jgi:Fe-S cluster assembly scaffold protein SufB
MGMRVDVDRRTEFEALVKAYEKAGGDVSKFLDRRIASIIISGDKVVGLNNVPGVELVPHTIEHGVHAKMIIKKGTKLSFPIHVCTGYLQRDGYQKVIFDIVVEEDAEAHFVAHCVFPWTEQFTHDALMNVVIKKNAKMSYSDEHYHSEAGTVNLITVSRVVVEEDGLYVNRFALTKTRVGKMRLDFSVALKDHAVADILARVRASGNDEVDIHEKVDLVGVESRAMLSTIVVALDKAKARVVNEAYGRGEHSKGHVKCEEITKGSDVQVSTVPILKVFNDKAELTHEASIGRVNAKQLETLMSKGLSEDEATELIIKGLLG